MRRNLGMTHRYLNPLVNVRRLARRRGRPSGLPKPSVWPGRTSA